MNSLNCRVALSGLCAFLSLSFLPHASHASSETERRIWCSTYIFTIEGVVQKIILPGATGEEKEVWTNVAKLLDEYSAALVSNISRDDAARTTELINQATNEAVSDFKNDPVNFFDPNLKIHKTIMDCIEKAEPLQHLVQRGIDLLEGRGVKRDPAAAALLFRQAANQGSALAGSKLASMYWEGIGVPKDLHKTFKWAKFAADRGDPAAQRMLGEIYEIGRGVPKDRDEALKLYKLAAKAGDITAQRLLKRMVKQAEGEKRWARMQNMTFNIVVVCEGDGRSDHDFEAAANLIGWAANHEIIPYQVLINYPQCFEPKRIIKFTDIQALVSSLTIREKGRHFYVAYKDKKNNISYGLIGID